MLCRLLYAVKVSICRALITRDIDNMWYNCTFPQNSTLNDACCPSGNATSSLDGHSSACLLGIGNATDFNKCLAEGGNVTDVKCYVQGFSNMRHQSSAGRKHQSVSWLSLACVALLLVGGAHAQQEEPVCTSFIPDDQSTWDLDAVMPHLVIGSGQFCTRFLRNPCLTGMSQRRFYFEPLWVADGGFPVTGDYRAHKLPSDQDFADRVWVPIVPDEFPFPQGYWGLLAVKTAGAVIPGTYHDCKNGTEYRGNVSVPAARGMYYFTTVETGALGRGPAPNETLSSQHE